MKKETFFSALRALFTFVGTFVIGHAVFGQAITTESWDVILGIVITISSAVWGIFDKTASIDQIESSLRSLIISGGGFATAAGWVKSETVTAFVGLATAIVPIFQSYFAKAKVIQIDKGEVSTNATTGKLTTNKTA